MIRTQISLDQEAYREAKAEAKREGISLAAFLRRSVSAALSGRALRKQPWMRYAGIVSSGNPDSSTSVDEVVYNRPRP